MRFSSIEIKDILKAWLVISLAFAILLIRSNPLNGILIIFIISLITVGFGFLFHELAHKFAAQKYKYFAEFKADNKMLLVSVVSAFFGFLLAAPGGVYIGGGTDNRKLSLIAASGPITNIVLALIFLSLSFLDGSFISLIGSLGFNINSWLALFNLIPISPFDGAKVLNGNKALYYSLAGISLFLMIITRIR